MGIEHYVSIAVPAVIILIFSVLAYRIGVKASKEDCQFLALVCVVFLVGAGYFSYLLSKNLSKSLDVIGPASVSIVEESPSALSEINAPN